MQESITLPLPWKDQYREVSVRGRALQNVVFGTCLFALVGWNVVAPHSAIGQSESQGTVHANPVPPAPEKQPPTAPPDFAVVKTVVEKFFASIENYQEADLIRQSDATQALDLVKDVGWDVPGRDAIIKHVLADGSFLVKELSSPSGRPFMRRVARHPGTYSRLERLSTISGGETLIRDLIRQKDGDKLIEYMATTPGGHNMGRMAASTKQGVDLNKATGHIYTAGDLVAELEKAYRAKDVKKLQNAK